MHDLKKMVTPPDILVSPQRDEVVPGDHLTTEEQANAIQSWRQWGHSPIPDQCKTWTVWIVHTIDGKPQLTRVRQIPQYIETM